MRLWHIDIIPFLPRSQLLAQWRELNSIFKKQDQHILINYIYEYEKEDLLLFTNAVLNEMRKREFQIRTFDKMQDYFDGIRIPEKQYIPFERHHNDEYLEICYFNLKEKYIRGQKDYDDELYMKLEAFFVQTSRTKQHQ